MSKTFDSTKTWEKQGFIPAKDHKEALIYVIRLAVQEEETIDYVSDMTAIMAAVAVTSIN